MLIGIDFGDNDFSSTIRAFLKIFKDSVLVELYPQNVTKENIIRLWDMLAPGCYWLAQDGFQDKNGPEEELSIINYLKITKDRIYLNEECIQNFYEDNNWSYWYIDTDTGEIYGS